MASPLIEPSGSNLTPETFLECLREWRKARQEQSERGTLVARIGKKMKNVGINKLAFDIFEKLNDLETDEALACLKAIVRYGKWTEKPYATQLDMFRDMPVEKPKAKAVEKYVEYEADEAGYKAGFSGEPIDNNPHFQGEPDDSLYASWRVGWQRGQAARVEKSFGGKEPKQAKSPGKRGRPKREAAAAPVEVANDDDGDDNDDDLSFTKH